jgi:diguanylate cyclase (GGDEF)-like protein
MDSIGTFGASRYAIRDLQLLRDADTPAVARLLAGCAVLRVTRGHRVEGLHARLLIVLAGALGIEAEGFVGDSGLTRILPGESVGEQSVLDDAANLDAIVALEDSEVLVIEPERVWQLIEQNNGVARNLLRLLSFRIRAANALLRRRQKLGEFYRQLSMNDGLTGLYNRAWLNDMLPKLVARARQDGSPLSIVMIDLDHFKRFNDTHGHMVGDHALCTAAGVIRGGLRPADFAVRYGGEEMMAILPHTNLQAAALVAERLCARLRETVVFDDMRSPLPHLTGSFGVACLASENDAHSDERSLVEAADAALYRAKQSGRDRICT